MVKLTDQWIAWFVREAAKGRETPRVWSAQKGVTVRYLQMLVKEYRETGKAPTLNPNRRPRGPPLLWDEQAAIVEAHKTNPVGATELWKGLQQAGWKISHEKVTTFYRQRGWSTPNRRKQKRRKRCRYERDHSGSLLHGDYHRTNDRSPHVILWLDDASRRILSGGEFPNATFENARDTLDDALRACAEWGLIVRQVNTDRGPQFYANQTSAHIKTIPTSSFERHLNQRGIDFVVSKAHNPQTNGKLERMWLEYDRHRSRFPDLRSWIAWQNHRPHSGLAWANPTQAFQNRLPVETLVGLFHRMTSRRPQPPTLEVLYANF